jgi:hypothetical protein
MSKNTGKETYQATLHMVLGQPYPLETGSILTLQRVDDNGREVTLYRMESSKEGHIVLDIDDWEEFKSMRYMFSIPELPNSIPALISKVKVLPALDEYVHRLAGGSVEDKEKLAQIEINTENGEVIELEVVAIENIIDVRYIDETTLQIKLPKKLAICEECGVVYVPRQKGQKYHSRKCANRASVRAFRERQKSQGE